MKAFNSLKMGEIDPSQINDESEEAKDSSSIINQNIALSLIKRSNSNSNSNNKSSDQISKVSSVSDIKNSSFVEGITFACSFDANSMNLIYRLNWNSETTL